jgi:hypothetical protein
MPRVVDSVDRFEKVGPERGGTIVAPAVSLREEFT